MVKKQKSKKEYKSVQKKKNSRFLTKKSQD